MLDLEEREPDVFVGQTPAPPLQRIFGGQVAGQALWPPAGRCRRTAAVHSLHSYFLRPGDPHEEIRYAVERIRDGRSFTHPAGASRGSTQGRGGRDLRADRRLPAGEEAVVEHTLPMPDVPAPGDAALDWPSRRARTASARPSRWASAGRSSSACSRTRSTAPPKTPPDTKTWVWMRVAGKLPDDPPCTPRR